MALGKPAISNPRGGGTERDVVIAIDNIRQRLEALEAAVGVATGAGLDTSALQRQISQLRSDLSALTSRVNALEAQVPTDWYVDGVLVGTRHRANFIHGSGITITGTDDTTNERVNIRFDVAGVNLSFPVTRTTVTINGRDLLLQLGKFLTVTQAHLVILGRTIGLSLSSNLLIDVDPAHLVLVPRTLGLSLSQSVLLAADRAALRMAGRNVGMVLGIPMGRAPVRLFGRDLGITVGSSISIPVVRGTINVNGRDVTVTAPTWTFFRNFTDLSTAGLTVYKGTVTAGSGNLSGTPAGGSVHERVYFDALPAGSPSDISGAWTIEVHCAIGLSTTLNAVGMNIQGDVSTDNTIQNGYWLDTLNNLPRFIRFVGGSATQLAIKSGGGVTSPVRLRITYDGVNTFHCEGNGSALFSDVVDSTFKHGRPGFVFFANPGNPGGLIDYAMNYT